MTWRLFMPKKLFVLFVALALFTVACGDDTSDTEEPSATGAPTTEPMTTEPMTTEPMTTEPMTTEPMTTEPMSTEPMTTEPMTDPLLELARGVAGSWTGEWTNTTFGSVGPISGEITVDEEAMELTVNSDVGGNVFGAADPDPELLTLPLTEGDHTGTSPTFGDWTLTISADGTFSMTSTNIPSLPGGTFTMEGALTDAGIEATYEVDFGSGQDPAEGVVSIMKS